jgi:hypothetical protein
MKKVKLRFQFLNINLIKYNYYTMLKLIKLKKLMSIGPLMGS